MLALPLFFLNSSTQVDDDETVIREIFDEALSHGECYENLRVLCKDVGGRLSGSPEAAKAVAWGKKLMDDYGFDKVYLQEIEVPHWVRGNIEEAKCYRYDAGGDEIFLKNLNVCALGHSIGTDGKTLTGEVIEVHHLEELEQLGREQLEGKIVFFNRPMDEKHINTFHAYGGCVDQRSVGANESGKFGAVGVIVRSMNLRLDDYPHTGVMRYEDGARQIPAVAISTNDAETLSKWLKESEDPVMVDLRLNCEMLGTAKSHNVIGEITGSEHPDKIILFGGHLDSWDLGEGAHDDGAGVVQSVEVLRIFKSMNLKPKHTIRAVLFMNEENGNNGGLAYARMVKEKQEVHIAAIETDRGGFSPRGFSIDAGPNEVKHLQQYRALLEPYGLHYFEPGYGGVDIGPLKDQDVILIGLVPDSQRYFDHHHAATDVFEGVNKRELELGAASMAALVFLIDKYGFES